jgi:hypothetical protein
MRPRPRRAFADALADCGRLMPAVAILLMVWVRPVGAHVGSPDVFLEGDAGAYHLFVTVRVPQVIPGVAEIEVRSESDDLSHIHATVTTLTGAGSQYAPVPDLAERSQLDPRFFTSSLWLMQNGSLQVRLIADGARGSGTLSVPIASFAQRTLKMPPWLGAILLFLTMMLALGALSIVGAAARESELEPGAHVPPEYRARARKTIAVGAAVVGSAFYLGLRWWSADARDYEAVVKFFKPPKIEATLERGNRLVLKVADPVWLEHVKIQELIPDHGHIMHLFLVKTPGLDRLWHLHPERMPDDTFVEMPPSIDAGHYQIFADVVTESGFPFTMVGEIDVPAISGGAPLGDDSTGSAQPIARGSADSDVFILPDGGKVIWQREASSLRAGSPMLLRFRIEDAAGRPASDLQPYMGMAAHAAIVRSDLTVFAHIHPSGSVPMASMMLARSQTGDSGASASASMPSMAMPGVAIAPDITLPYGFPQSGLYRIFLQFKRHDRIDTAVFDVRVSAGSR